MAGLGVGGSAGSWVLVCPDDEQDHWERDFMIYAERVTYLARKQALMIYIVIMVGATLTRLNYQTRAAKAIFGALLLSACTNCIWTYLDLKTRRSLMHRRTLETVFFYCLQLTSIAITPFSYGYTTFSESPARAFLVPTAV